MAIKQRRPVVCYGCGLTLGTVETTLGPRGMEAFRKQAKDLREEHQCNNRAQKAQ